MVGLMGIIAALSTGQLAALLNILPTILPVLKSLIEVTQDPATAKLLRALADAADASHRDYTSHVEAGNSHEQAADQVRSQLLGRMNKVEEQRWFDRASGGPSHG